MLKNCRLANLFISRARKRCETLTVKAKVEPKSIATNPFNHADLSGLLMIEWGEEYSNFVIKKEKIKLIELSASLVNGNFSWYAEGVALEKLPIPCSVARWLRGIGHAQKKCMPYLAGRYHFLLPCEYEVKAPAYPGVDLFPTCPGQCPWGRHRGAVR